MNRPYVKQYLVVDGEKELLNPINGYFPSKRSNKAFPEGFPNRKERRNALVNRPRVTSNRRGNGLVVTQIGRNKFMKYERFTQIVGKKQIIHFREV